MATALVGVPIARADSSPFTAISKALANVRSYQIDITITSSGGTASATTGTIAVVGRGKSARIHLSLTVKVSRRTLKEDIVVNGTRACYKITGLSPKYTCRTDPAFAASFKSLENPNSTFTAPGASITYRPSSPKTINGQICNGYSFNARAGGGQGQGTIYIAQGTNLPCEEDASAFATMSGKRTNVQTKAVWSRFNANIPIPSV